ncbi:purine nucleoside permease [Rubellicoccus peritrichatus]|uniref:Purine nucleoside permease n=1 Tax=Rubellicoccus peritrichatus TaxID=3080537 RepID=A0AAQ3LCL2_9BACT|nr:purine nucleoside permease [Puniceicoccus sp. CR14]WOO41979.1 purine nucleoside permease [Puniceicoccus sp. CR14]
MPSQVKVVLITMFEPPGDMPGELSVIREREGLVPFELPGSGLKDLYRSPDGQILAIVAGVGTANTSISMMALGMSPELDLSEAYWIVVGIAGGNPNVCSLGSPVWADWCVDGDLAFEVDAREIPEEWPCGILPLGSKEPYGESSMPQELFGYPYQVYRLNSKLIERSVSLTKDIELYDNPEIAEIRNKFENDTATQPPRIQTGGTLAAARFWHGARHNAWAERWVDYWTGGNSQFFTSGMEDTGTLHAIAHLHRVKQANMHRVLILRTISNYTMPPPGGNVIDSLTGSDHDGEFPAHAVALENGYRAVSTVFRDIIKNPDVWASLSEA